MISDEDIYKHAYADGYNAGYTQGTLRAESRESLGLPIAPSRAYDDLVDDARDGVRKVLVVDGYMPVLP